MARMTDVLRHVFEAPRSSPVAWLLRGLVLVVVVAVLAWHVVEAWSIATWIGEDYLTAEPPAAVDDAAIVGVESDRVTLRGLESANTDVASPGVFGFATDNVYLRLGPVVTYGVEDVTRTFETIEGTEPVIGEFGHLDLIAMPADSLQDLGIREATYPGPLGAMAALAIDGSDTWVIYVHDRLAPPEQAVPMMAALANTGVSQLSITYRNDPGQPAGESGRFSFGVEEREDLGAAVDHARASGAEQVILVGYGTGGSVVMAELFRDIDIAGAILDSPSIDAQATVMAAASVERTGVLGLSAGTANWLGTVLTGVRYGVDWQTGDYLARADRLGVPTLVIHAGADEANAIEESRALAHDRPDHVRLVEIERAGTGLAWNTDPAAYESLVLDFVDVIRMP